MVQKEGADNMNEKELTIIKDFYAEADKEYKAALASYQQNPDSRATQRHYQEAAVKHKAIFDLCCLLNITVWTDKEE